MAELRRIKNIQSADPEESASGDFKNDLELNAYDNDGFMKELGDEKGLPTRDPSSRDRDLEDDDDEEDNACARFTAGIQTALSDFIEKNSSLLWNLFYIILIIAYFIYFAYSLSYKFGDEGSWRLLVCTVLISIGLTLKYILQFRRQSEDKYTDGEEKDEECCPRLWRFVEKIRLAVILPVVLFLFFIVYIIVDVGIDSPRNLISLGGMTFFILSFYIFSFNPSKVKWRPVFWGIALQIIFALLILRTSWGRDAFKWLGDRVTEFLSYTDAGSKFVFGDLYINHFFAFKVLPVVVYFSTCVSMLYYLGVMQVVIRQLGKFLTFCLGTSPSESINAAGNIFIGQTEAPLMIRPFLNDMTNSEIHAVMTGGFATIAGSVMAAYILYDVPANHLLSASVMSAPAALALSKLFYPETERSRHRAEDVYNIAKGEERNLIEAASNGASMSIKLVANIAVNLIAFVALLDFVNATLVWLGDRAGYDGFTFQLICSYVFWPLAFLMGVDLGDCEEVAELIGTKTFLNEFVAYVDLSKYIKNQEKLNEYIANATANVTGNLTGKWGYRGDDIYLDDIDLTLKRGILSYRSVVIATYALCGFSNLASMGVQLGALGAMAPNRKGDMSRIVIRAMIAGNVACFMTASIAGLLYTEE
ncbi:solute carrier family 28 member 3 [Aplysia californica]|uniref:Sodium/nucleoside cotransporter n=1 Tax=Aplysia californica TaxID=6500 RepID=A0ABM1VQC6_APLCA|nr:solute carrier family 28 member 3 [Aplysia californica]XP_035824618.1 solute carrier family 28 member 3 [Aplysia californica]